MFQTYFEVFYSLLVEGCLLQLKIPSLSAHGYQLLPLATSQYVGDNRKFDVSGIFWGVFIIVDGGELMTIEDPSLSAYGYQLLPLATSYLVGNNREFDVSDIVWGLLNIVGIEELITIKNP